MAEFTLGTERFQSRKIEPMTQMKIVKRIMPVIGSITAVHEGKFTGKTLMGSLTGSLGKLADDDLDYIVAECLKVTRKQEVNMWADTWNLQVNKPQYANMELLTILQICVAVIMDNIAGFSNALGALGVAAPGADPTTKA